MAGRPLRRARRTNGTRAALIQHMVRCGYPREDAEAMAPKAERADSTRRALTPDELRRFERAVRSDRTIDAAVRAILLLLPVTGMRVAEACSLRMSALDAGGKGRLKAEVLGKARGGRPKIGKNGRGPNGERIVYDDKARVVGGRNIGRMVDKHGKPVKAPPQLRTVPLGRHGTSLVREYVAKHRPRGGPDRVFIGPRGGAITTAMVQAACRAVANRAGLKGVTPHFLRHSFVSQAIAKCWDPRRVREIIGHGKKDATGKSIGGRLPAVTLLYIDDKVLRGPRANGRVWGSAEYDDPGVSEAVRVPYLPDEDYAVRWYGTPAGPSYGRLPFEATGPSGVIGDFSTLKAAQQAVVRAARRRSAR